MSQRDTLGQLDNVLAGIGSVDISLYPNNQESAQTYDSS